MHLIIQFILFLPALVVWPIHIGRVVFAFASNLSSFQPPDTWIQPLKSIMVSAIGRTNRAAQMYRFDSVNPNTAVQICHHFDNLIQILIMKCVTLFDSRIYDYSCWNLFIFENRQSNLTAQICHRFKTQTQI